MTVDDPAGRTERSAATTATAEKLRVGVGYSDAADAVEAGRAASADALAGLHGATPALIVMYASVSYDLIALLHAVRRATGKAPLVGATTSGQFHDGRLINPGLGVSVLALSAGPYRFGVASVTGVTEDGDAAGQRLARAARAAAGPEPAAHAALLLLTTGLAGHQQELLNGVHKVLGAPVPVVGGSAGDDRLLIRTCVFENDNVLTDGGATGVWIAAPTPLSVVAEHGWHDVGLPLLVTKSDGLEIQEIAGRPAVEVFQEHFHDDVNFERPGLVKPAPGYLSAYAFGLIQPDGSKLIRGAYIDDEGLLKTFSPLPLYAPVQIVSCRAEDLLRVTGDVVRRSLAGRDAAVLLAFSCVARLDVLAEQGAEEAALIQDAAGDVATFGFYTYGEFARTTRVAGYHNATLTAIAL
ncbi:FIST signal transduction protein [Catellatospora paridis]|uniref:FIST signal transduction protein n=1 Tax=Catellatospora paridis TaxID=1617086 RepID=UPI0012D3E5E8|nr:FIST N-terminal domain-containing protein [Catellatospora paridis]